MKTGTRPEIAVTTPNAKLQISVEAVIADFRLAVRSRAASELSRRGGLIGKAPFGISGEGKEIAQLAMARAFRPGDWRSGYYRDQTFMFAVGLADLSQYFAQLYADPDVVRDPNSAGRQMLSHFATRVLDEEGRWKDLLATGQSASDLSPVGAQMPRSVGLAWASKLYRESPALRSVSRGFSRNGEEVCFATIGNAGTTEGVFWESLNAVGVLGAPLIVSIWDDGYGISVPNELQTTKGSISALLEGFRRGDGTTGYDIHVVKGHDYLACCDVYQIAAARARRDHIPAVVHVTEMTQPQGHSTSGSHERYKSKDRLRFEIEFDPIRRMRDWMLREELVDAATLDEFERTDRATVERIREEAYEAAQAPIRADRERALTVIEEAERESRIDLTEIVAELRSAEEPSRRLIAATAARAIVRIRAYDGPARVDLMSFADEYRLENEERFNSHLYSESAESPLRIGPVAPAYSDQSETVDGRMVLLRCFDENLARDPRLVILGEDVGRLGDVNLVFEGLQARHGVQRDMTRAAGLYNTLLRGDDPAIVIEVLSGYRLKERMPDNVGEFTIPLGAPETIREGRDLTLVTYGALCRIAEEAASDLSRLGIEVEIVDVQTLLPFDRQHAIGRSVAKTGALLVVDEDVPGGASAYILREVLEVQGAIDHLEVGARTLTGTANRVAVGNDGDYFSKPNREDIVAAGYAIMRDRRPDDFPPILAPVVRE